MSIHFRSRIQSPIDYSDQLFPGTNGCCCTGSNSPFPASYGECNAVDGYFQADLGDSCASTLCLPTGKTGCCCACLYGGMTEGIEYSFCQDIDGAWQEGNCPTNADEFCVNSAGRDVRLKRACCGYTSGNVPMCFNVCTEQDCYNLRSGNLASTFYPTGGNCEQINPSCSSPQDSSLNNNTVEIYGNCCVQGSPCRCYKNVTIEACNFITGAFYLSNDPEFSCTDCINNCSETE